MTGEIEELYQSIILDHNRRPKNFREIEGATGHAEGVNPLCGDQIGVWVKVEGDRVSDVSFRGQGCAISKASASMMTQAVKGKSRAEAQKLFDDVHALVTGRAPAGDLGSLKALSGVSRFPMRVKCASLAWHALRAAMAGSEATVSTERPGEPRIDADKRG